MGLGEKGEREEVFGPAQHEGIGGCCDDAGKHDRKHDPPDHAKAGAAVDDRRLVQRARHGFEIADQEIDGERDRDRGVDEEHRQMVVDQAELREQDEQRRDQDDPWKALTEQD